MLWKYEVRGCGLKRCSVTINNAISNSLTHSAIDLSIYLSMYIPFFNSPYVNLYAPTSLLIPGEPADRDEPQHAGQAARRPGAQGHGPRD